MLIRLARYLQRHAGIRESSNYAQFILAGLVLILVLHLTFNSSQDLCDIVLAFLHDQIRILSPIIGANESNALLKAIPRSVKTVLSLFDLEPTVNRYIVCPKCYAPYPLSDKDSKSIKSELRCEHRTTPASLPCGEKMTRCTSKNARDVHRPIKEYYHQDMREWVGRFICRPEIELTLRKRREEFQRRKTAAGQRQDGDDDQDPGPLTYDILDSPTIEGFKWPDGRTWYDCPDNEYRLFFYVTADGFNPLSNGKGGQTASSTAIYLFCANLPLEERHKPENVYLVGVIPGPGKPCGSQINHYISLLVDDLEPSYDPGVQYSRTHHCPGGALVRTAAAPIVSDGVAAREMSGYSSITSRFFCTFCWLPISHIENFVKSSWPSRDLFSHRYWAELWKEAPDEQTQADILSAHGIRYTPFLRLPYFNPITFTIVDTMHNFFLGLLHRHCREIWGMDLRLEESDGERDASKSPPPVPSVPRMQAARRAVEFNDHAALAKMGVPVLWYLCLELDLRRGGNKRDLLRELQTWVFHSIHSLCSGI